MENLRAAYKIIEERSFDVAVADTSLPDGDSFDLIRTIRKEHPFTRILAISGYMSVNSVAQSARAAGAHAIAEKPLKPDEFISAVYDLLDPTGSQRGRVLALRGPSPIPRKIV